MKNSRLLSNRKFGESTVFGWLRNNSRLFSGRRSGQSTGLKWPGINSRLYDLEFQHGCVASVKRPDLFKGLVLLGASPRYITSDDYEGGFRESEIEDLISNIKSKFHTWSTHFPSLVMDAKDALSQELLRTSLKQMRTEVALAVAETVFRSDNRNVLPKISVPCTIVQPSNDVVVPVSVAYYMKENIKGKSTVEIVEMEGHYPQLTAHLRLLDVLLGVLGS